jgi:hypothetical protein
LARRCHDKLHERQRKSTYNHGNAIKTGMARAAKKGTKASRPIGRPSVLEGTRIAIRTAYMAGELECCGVADFR